MKKIPHPTQLHKDMYPCLKVLANDGQSGSEMFDIGLKHMQIVDDKGRYQHYFDVVDRVRNPDKALAIWSLVKLGRVGTMGKLAGLWDVLSESPGFIALPGIQRVCSVIDRQCTAPGLRALFDSDNVEDSAFREFLEDEGIASSQLEGASTTRVVARQMLEENRPARNESERMILGNHRLMNMVWQSRYEDMSVAFLQSLHEAATSGIDDDSYHPGQLREDNSVYVAGRDDEKVHIPPDFNELPARLKAFVNWINFDHEAQKLPRWYLHPVVKACIMHFCLGYLHPFYDGNGRVARALCYWQLFRAGYDAFRYISISRLLKEAPVQYGEAYIRTETDEMDLTYFVEYQCRILERSINDTFGKVREKINRLREFENWMFRHGIRSKLTTIQLTIVNLIVVDDLSQKLTVKRLVDSVGISDGAARQNLERMVDAGLLTRSGGGGSKPVVYTPKKSIDQIKKGIASLIS
ncbi:TPA: Fic family protein [Citrobacter braakii]